MADEKPPSREEHEALKRENEELKRKNRALEERLRDLEAKVRRLGNMLRMTSSNSSLPPSSDWMREPTPKPPTGRKRGGQPGHPGATRPVFPAAEVDHVVRLTPERCAGCFKPLTGLEILAEIHQVVEIPPSLAEVTEYQCFRRTCACGVATTADLPKDVPVGCVGPRFQAVLTSLTGRYRLSRREACEAAQALYGPKARIALGTMSALEKRTSQAMAGPYEEGLLAIRREKVVNADETSWMLDRHRAWLWAATCPCLSVFRIDPTRSQVGFHALMGEDYGGILGTDRWTGYLGHPVRRRQLCWAHLKRNFKALTEQWHKGATHIGNQGLLAEKAVTRAWRGYLEGRIAHVSLRVILHPIRKRLKAVLLKGCRSTEWKTRAMSRDVLKRFTALWTFTRKLGVEPTNNRAERVLRKAVLWRKGSFGSDSAAGCRFAERMLTASETLKVQGRNLVDFVEASIRAQAVGRSHPSLLTVRSG